MLETKVQTTWHKISMAPTEGGFAPDQNFCEQIWGYYLFLSKEKVKVDTDSQPNT